MANFSERKKGSLQKEKAAAREKTKTIERPYVLRNFNDFFPAFLTLIFSKTSVDVRLVR